MKKNKKKEKKKLDNKYKNENVLFISSMGGHLTELLTLKPLFNKYNSMIVTEKIEEIYDLEKRDDLKNIPIKYLAYGTKKNLFKYFFIFAFNCFKSLNIFLKFKPKVIVTTGTHTAVPMCYIAKIFRKKVIFIETYANIKTKTLSGKLVGPIADSVVVQWEPMKKLYKNPKFFGGIF